MSNLGSNGKPSPSEGSAKYLAERVDELRSALQLQDPELLARRSGASYLTLGPERGELHVPLWGNGCILTWPTLIGYSALGDALPVFQQAFLLYYLLTADGTPLANKWVSFAELPNGRMYNAAFQGYSGDEIVKAFGLNLEPFKHACIAAGGQLVEMGSASFIFQALPRVPVMLTYWLGDEDFPSSCKVLFDASAGHYLPIDVCAILGSMLTRKVVHS
jgi:hypothetical protein